MYEQDDMYQVVLNAIANSDVQCVVVTDDRKGQSFGGASIACELLSRDPAA
jgi:hypothetical protein